MPHSSLCWTPPGPHPTPRSHSQARVDDDGGGGQRLAPRTGVLSRVGELQPGAFSVLLRKQADLRGAVILVWGRAAFQGSGTPHLVDAGRCGVSRRVQGIPALTRTTLLKEPMRKGWLPQGCPLCPYAIQGLSISTSPSASTHLRP